MRIPMPEDTYDIMIDSQAAVMLEQHIAFVTNVSKTAAVDLYKEIRKTIDSLAEMPYRCPVYQTQYTTKRYRRILVNRYAILYTIDETNKTVRIEYVWDTRMEHEL
jgi:plasmid stabilization system protein ParE